MQRIGSVRNAKLVTSFANSIETKVLVGRLAREASISQSELVRRAIVSYARTNGGSNMSTITWKDFVVMLCKNGSTNTSKEISEFLRGRGHDITVGQVAAVKANFTMNRYN